MTPLPPTTPLPLSPPLRISLPPPTPKPPTTSPPLPLQPPTTSPLPLPLPPLTTRTPQPLTTTQRSRLYIKFGDNLLTFSAFFFSFTISSRFGIVPPSHPMTISLVIRI